MAKGKPDPKKIYVAWTGFAVEGVPGVTPKGTRLRGSAPAVQRAFQFFVEDGTPSGEWPSEFDRGVEESERTDRADRAAAARQEVPPIPDDEAVEVLEPFTIGFRRIEAGTRFRRDDFLVKRHPEFFGTPRKPLVR